MKTKELIKQLKELDKTGNKEIFIAFQEKKNGIYSVEEIIKISINGKCIQINGESMDEWFDE